jgi:hypothetical protein
MRAWTRAVPVTHNRSGPNRAQARGRTRQPAERWMASSSSMAASGLQAGHLGDVLELLLRLEGLGQRFARAPLLLGDRLDQALRAGAAVAPGPAVGGHHRQRLGVVAGALALERVLGVQRGHAHLGGDPPGGDLGQALLQGLHLVGGDADQGLSPFGHAAAPCRRALSEANEWSRRVTSALSWVRKASSAGLMRMARSSVGSAPAR